MLAFTKPRSSRRMYMRVAVSIMRFVVAFSSLTGAGAFLVTAGAGVFLAIGVQFTCVFLPRAVLNVRPHNACVILAMILVSCPYVCAHAHMGVLTNRVGYSIDLQIAYQATIHTSHGRAHVSAESDLNSKKN
jgi:hypothetical protein